jgi:hypothetical protein
MKRTKAGLGFVLAVMGMMPCGVNAVADGGAEAGAADRAFALMHAPRQLCRGCLEGCPSDQARQQ